jgi:trk system potassium uptake protein TrkA
VKKIVIVGAGEIGAFLADRLTAEQIEVTVIDRNPDVLSRLQNTMDVAGVLGNATSIGDLRDAGVMDADLFVATTRQDETNLIACLLARELKVPHTIAVTRYLGMRGQVQPFNRRALNIDLLVNSSEAVKNEVMDNIETTGASEVARFAEGRIILIGYQVPEGSPVVGRTVSDLCANGAEPRFFAAGIVRADELVESRDDLRFQPDDYLYMITTAQHLPELNRELGVETLKTRNAVIFGDNFLSQILATALLNRHFHVTMLAATEEKSQFLKNHFKDRHHFQVETGFGTEVKLLRRVKVPNTSLFIASNTDDAANLTACMVAKALGAGKTIATIRRTDILPLCRHAGVDVNIAPRLATAKVIQRVVHENRVVDYRAVSQTNLEVIELVAKAGSKAVKGPLRSLKLPKGAIIGAVAGAAGASLPTPELRIQPDDKVIVLTLPQHLLEVEAFFGG